MADVGYHIRNGWLQKPPLGVQLNWAHPLTKGLVGCWLFNEGGGDKAYDLSGYNNHGTLNNMAFPSTAASGWNPSKDGVGLTFDGSADYLGCGNDPSLSLNDELTIEAELNVAAKGTTAQITGKGAQGYSNKHFQLALAQAGTKLTFSIGDGTNFAYRQQATQVTIGQWYHLVGVRNGGGNNITMYANGVPTGNLGVSGTTGDITNNNNVLIGKESGHFNGSINYVRLYNRALSAFEIGWLYRKSYAMSEPATKYTIIDERLATDYVGGNVMAAELI